MVFCVIQAFMINGLYEAMRGKKLDDINRGIVYEGSILYMVYPKFFEYAKDKYWAKPIFVCVKCMSSLWGAITFFPLVIYLFGWHLEEIFVYIVDVFCLVPLNYIIYKKV